MRSDGPHRFIGAVFLLAVIAGCDPVAGVTVSSLLRPAPNADCLARALGDSPLVATVHENTSPPGGGYAVALRDSMNIAAIDPDVRVRLVKGGADTSRIEVLFRLYGRPTWAVDKEDSRRLRSVGEALARDVAKLCAPGSPESLSCRVEGMFWTKGCG